MSVQQVEKINHETKVKDPLNWKEKVLFYTKKEGYTKVEPKPYEIYTADFGERNESNVGSEITKVRPCLILTRTNYNAKSSVVTVIPITKKKFASIEQLAVNEYYLEDGIVDGVLKIEMITTISKGRLGSRIGRLNQRGVSALSKRLDSFLTPLNHKV